MNAISIGGARYYVTFIEDHSRKVWAYALKSKDRALEKFKHFQASIEREIGRKLKCVRSDNGSEYIGPFKECCIIQSIKFTKIEPKTPQHNGIAERMNRTINEKFYCMLSNAKLPKSYCGEVMELAVLSPSVYLDHDVSQRVWTWKDVSYDYLRVFDCKAFVHVPRDKRSNLMSKTMQWIFIGYCHKEFGYKFWDPVNKKVIRSRDAIFFEDQTIIDFEKPFEPKFSNEELVDMGMVRLPMVHAGDNRDVQVADLLPIDVELVKMRT